MEISAKSLAQAQYMAEVYNRLCALQGDKSRMDADETNMLAQELEAHRARVYETKYPNLKARLFLPTNREDDTGAETVTYEETDEVGEAKIIHNMADDFPTVETSGVKISFSVVSIGDSYIWSIQDVRRSVFSGKPLSSKKAIAARRAFERKLDSVAFSGSPVDGIASGFSNNASVGIEALAAAGTWATKTAQQMLDDLNKLASGLFTTGAELWDADTLLLPSAQFKLIEQTQMSTDSGESVLAAFLRANSGIQRVASWNLLSGAGAGGLDRAVLYMADPEVLELVIPQEFEVFPPQPQNLAWKVLCHGRTAGCHVYQPLGLRYMDGI